MKILTTLQNKFIVDKQLLEVELENELNSTGPSPKKIDKILDKITRVNLKQELWNNYVDQIIKTHERTFNDDINNS